MNKNIIAGVEIHTDTDKEYSVGSVEECEEFAKNRKFEIQHLPPKKNLESNVSSKSRLEDGKNG